MTKESFSDLPPEEMGDKKEKKDEVEKNIEELKKRSSPKNWLKEKFDVWRHEK